MWGVSMCVCVYGPMLFSHKKKKHMVFVVKYDHKTLTSIPFSLLIQIFYSSLTNS